MITVTSEYISLNPKLNEINDIIANTRQEYDKKDGDYFCRKVEVRCNINFFDENKNKTKNITIKHFHLHGIKKRW